MKNIYVALALVLAGVLSGEAIGDGCRWDSANQKWYGCRGGESGSEYQVTPTQAQSTCSTCPGYVSPQAVGGEQLAPRASASETAAVSGATQESSAGGDRFSNAFNATFSKSLGPYAAVVTGGTTRAPYSSEIVTVSGSPESKSIASIKGFKPYIPQLDSTMSQAGGNGPSVVYSNVMHLGQSVVDNKEKFEKIADGIYKRKEDGTYFAARNGIYQPVVNTEEGPQGAFDSLTPEQTSAIKSDLEKDKKEEEEASSDSSEDGDDEEQEPLEPHDGKGKSTHKRES